jgi:hypothetical protein
LPVLLTEQFCQCRLGTRRDEAGLCPIMRRLTFKLRQRESRSTIMALEEK